MFLLTLHKQTFDGLIMGAEVVARSVNKSKPKVERTYLCSKTTTKTSPRAGDIEYLMHKADLHLFQSYANAHYAVTDVEQIHLHDRDPTAEQLR